MMEGKWAKSQSKSVIPSRTIAEAKIIFRLSTIGASLNGPSPSHGPPPLLSSQRLRSRLHLGFEWWLGFLIWEKVEDDDVAHYGWSRPSPLTMVAREGWVKHPLVIAEW
ncbi:hypothetical protein DEO72_LG5g1505 [Vigna unguiculata]|uniref:Uncharacterized protein n=1 Tax=Vigna unguiculata TaxID=3917 RepID=A0A4D6LY36_VIGUN|nr:hypothetical protein DEO72_LG5g1505 [Vigna unguiculata]